MLYLIGLGLSSETDISLKALDILKESSDSIYVEFHTNFFSGDLKKLIKYKEIIHLNRSDIEENLDEFLLKDAKNKNVSLLVPGDPMIATTHISIIMRAEELGIETKIIHSSSIYSGIAETGLFAYKFGKTASIPYPEKSYFPIAPYDIFAENQTIGAHTLFLLDVKSEEKPPRFMSVNEGIHILLDLESRKRKNLISKNTAPLCVGIARLGSDDQIIKTGKAVDLLNFDFGAPPHALIITGKLHFVEEEAINRFL